MENHLNATDIVQRWLQDFNKVVSTNDISAFAALFLEDGWLRDNLIFTWDHRSLEGRNAIKEFLSHTDDEVKPNETRLSNARISDIKLASLYKIIPAITPHNLVEGTFTFETPIFLGKGYVQLSARGEGEEKDWKAFTLYVAAAELKGHEEDGTPIGYYDNHAKTWQEAVAEERRKIEEDPHVIVLWRFHLGCIPVGAGHNGLNVGARFRQMRIPTLLIDKSDRVGDVWRDRYPSLTLHTPKTHHTMLYTQPPSNWPKFTPRDKVAHMLEQYAINQELVIWHRSTILPNPVYDPITKRWTVEVLKDGEKITLHPYHIVLAVGIFGLRYVPDLPGVDLFHGDHCHAEQFKGAEYYEGKRVVVVGAAQTSSDICLDLVLHDAASVTMVQRSSTIVISIDLTNRGLDAIYPMGVDPNVGDFRSSGMPIGLLKKLAIAGKDARVAEQKSMLDGLEKAGLKLSEGEEGGGFPVQLYAYGNGVDIGAADHIINGRIKIKSGEPERFTKEGLIFKDGSFIEADAVIFATGYYPVQYSLIPIFGKELGERICPPWGLDKEGEMIRNFRPCGHPGAIQIKARLLGLVKD
ncbi:hypothetical protein Clacol_006021 [Clathrus columnatus]|uniref:FAD/NAD(P)-binding domain-containing protein n=1 Tax=Clathrus columnatus TaxID=1419009 RepID=A0AAV5AF70_9AGAM|nr:hypothetical protein Clacol_006021 [Clathrus columnatus]